MSWIAVVNAGSLVCVTLAAACSNHAGEASPANSDTTQRAEPASGLTAVEQSVRQVAKLRTARAAHTATTLPAGQVLVVGGMANGASSLASVELFDPTNNSVQEIRSLAEGRVSHTATLLGNGSVVIAGGYNGEYLASLEIFDPETQSFRAGGSLVE